MTMDDATRRQLRFSLFLQGAALLMFLAAFVAQLLTAGSAVLTAVFGLATLLVAAAIVLTTRKIRAG